MLSISLILIIGIFCGLMFAVLAFCLRERKRSLAVQGGGSETGRVDDARVVKVLFVSIGVGALLALLTMYLVFFRQWE